MYRGRPSKWGNPFVLGKDGSREEVVLKFKKWFMSNTKLVEEAKIELKDKVLGCWCSPQICHGDIISEVVNNENY
mgnify:CR=1 FL=1